MMYRSEGGHIGHPIIFLRMCSWSFLRSCSFSHVIIIGWKDISF